MDLGARAISTEPESAAGLDEDVCYRALASRDARFDGRFFTAVLTTGIYCRPICPARTPKRENVRFYPSAAAAERAGFRACLRCRPESAPGSAAWIGRSAVVARALKMIAGGAMEDDDYEAFAARLGVGGRHLRRLFVEEIGAPPQAVMFTRRLHFARRLIAETELQMQEIAFAAGFKSIRRFNDAIQKSFARSPRELRRSVRDGGIAAREGLTLRLEYRPPFDWDQMIRFISARAILGVEVISPERIIRSLEAGGEPCVVEIKPAEGAVMLTIHGAQSERILSVVDRTKRAFDLEADPLKVSEVLSRDRRLKPVLKANSGVRVPGAWDPFEVCVRAILGQQVRVSQATALAGALVQALGTRLPPALHFEGGPTHLFPSAARVAEASPEKALIKVPGARWRAIVSLAGAVARGEVDFLGDLCAARAALAELPGFGPWTVEYAMMRAFGDPDAFPAGDLGLRKALDDVSEKEARTIAEAWRPWRSYATMALWNCGKE